MVKATQTHAVKPSATAGTSGPDIDGAAPADRLRILIVDDEPTIRHVIGQVLRLDGHDPTEVASAEEALATFRERPFPIIITDIIMGPMNGLELLREIKKIDPSTLVVIMTSQGTFDSAIEALRDGAYDFLTKPFEHLDIVSAVVNRASDRLQLQQQNERQKSQLEIYARELGDMANRDMLTGLFNRRYLRKELDEQTSQRDKHPLSIIMLDVDHFKTYNDTHGHLAGDAVLSGVGAILRDAIPESGVSARYGGEEFVVLLPSTHHGGAAEIAEAIRRRVETHPFEGRERQPGGKVTVSLGVATFSDQDGDSNALIGRADEALYRAKETGRNRVVRAEP